jgi:D-alanyl-lipoteichoic acid acyltransferase DltB (MBOAT superfamily)
MYKKESAPVKSLLDFSLFVTFFPHLVAGPIVRPPQLVPQFEHPRSATKKQLLDGLLLLSLGLFMKVVLADALLADTADAVFNSPDALSSLDAWTGVFAFSGQIFLDFAGYSTCAIGVALCLGFVLPQNFNYPYAAIGFSDFWKRWHITLSAWLRDYLYIPLGGNKNGAIEDVHGLDAHHAPRRIVARRQLDVRGLGRFARFVFVGEKFINDRRKISKEEKERQNRNWIGLLYAF